MPNNFRRQMWISIALIVGSAAAAGGILYFLFGRIAAVSQKIMTDRTLLAQRSEAIASLAGLKHDAAVAQGYKAAMSKILVSEDQLFFFQQWLDSVAAPRRIGVTYVPDGTQTASGPSSAGSNGFTLDITANKPQDIADFLEDIEFRSPQFLVAIDSVDIQKNGALYTAATRGKVFFK